VDGHDPLTLTSLSLLYRFVNVLYVRNFVFTAEHFLSHMASRSHAL
jgi:hypothetical protein